VITSKKYRTIMAILVCITVLLVVIFVPFNLVLSPERRLIFVDDAGKPIAHAEVRRSWQQYSLGLSGEERIKTDSDGAVYFQTRSIKTRIIWLIVGAVREIRSVGIHAGFGSSDYIMIRINNQDVKSFYDGKGLENARVVIKR